jgi:hypothetical protein
VFKAVTNPMLIDSDACSEMRRELNEDGGQPEVLGYRLIGLNKYGKGAVSTQSVQGTLNKSSLPNQNPI